MRQHGTSVDGLVWAALLLWTASVLCAAVVYLGLERPMLHGNVPLSMMGWLIFSSSGVVAAVAGMLVSRFRSWRAMVLLCLNLAMAVLPWKFLLSLL